VLHHLAIFGGRYSETLGYGARNGNEVRFVFEYPDAPFHISATSLTMNLRPSPKCWTWMSFGFLGMTNGERPDL
jgi:hypothetical protein